MREPNKTKLLQGCTDLLAAYEQAFPMSGLHIAFLTIQKTVLSNGVFTSTWKKGCLRRMIIALLTYSFNF